MGLSKFTPKSDIQPLLRKHRRAIRKPKNKNNTGPGDKNTLFHHTCISIYRFPPKNACFCFPPNMFMFRWSGILTMHFIPTYHRCSSPLLPQTFQVFKGFAPQRSSAKPFGTWQDEPGASCQGYVAMTQKAHHTYITKQLHRYQKKFRKKTYNYTK